MTASQTATSTGCHNVLELFAGVGGGILGHKLLGWRTVCAVEFQEYQRKVLQARQNEGYLESFPFWNDARTFDGKPWRGSVHIVAGGFPCQPFSKAGRARGTEDSRNLWPDTFRIIRDVRPNFGFFENVTHLLSFEYFGKILTDLSSLGYVVRYVTLPASAVGAPHGRPRVWILAADADSLRLEKKRLLGCSVEKFDNLGRSWWSTEPGVSRVDDGVAYRMDRLISTGNGQVAGVVRAAWYRLILHDCYGTSD